MSPNPFTKAKIAERELAAAAELASIRAKKSGIGRVILAVDPGTSTSGIAVLVDGRPRRLTLVRAIGDTIQRRVADMAWNLVDELQTLIDVHKPDTLAVEWQAIRPTDKRPNDILHLAMVVGAVLGSVRHREIKILTPLPVSWKGSIDGDTFTQRILDHFGKDQLPPVGGGPPHLHHNAYDALGLAAWAINERRPWQV